MAKDELSSRIGVLIHDVSRLRRTVVDHALGPMGVTRSQWWVLANLSRHNGAAELNRSWCARRPSEELHRLVKARVFSASVRAGSPAGALRR